MGTRFVKPRVSRLYLRIPNVDWPGVSQGRKTELREYMVRGSLIARTLNVPTPVVGYVLRPGGDRFKMLVVEEVSVEPVGAISPESLEREGFKSRAEFRSYWRKRYRRAFQPEGMVQVYRLRPFEPADRAVLAERLFDHLYGEYVDA